MIKRFLFYVTLALRDLVRFPSATILQALIVAGVCFPILILLALKRGHVAELRHELVTSPTGRLVKLYPAGAGVPFSLRQLDSLAKSLGDVELAIPKVRRIVNLSLTKDGLERQSDHVDLNASCPGDPLLKAQNADVFRGDCNEIVLNETVAAELGAEVGETITVAIARSSSPETEIVDLVLKAVISAGSEARVGYADAVVIDRLTRYHRGGGVTEWDWPSRAEPPPERYPALLLVKDGSDPLKPAALEYLKQQGFEVNRAGAAEHNSLGGALRPECLNRVAVYHLTRKRRKGDAEPRRITDDPAALSKATLATNVIVPWYEPRQELVDGEKTKLVGLTFPVSCKWLRKLLVSADLAFDKEADYKQCSMAAPINGTLPEVRRLVVDEGVSLVVRVSSPKANPIGEAPAAAAPPPVVVNDTASDAPDKTPRVRDKASDDAEKTPPDADKSQAVEKPKPDTEKQTESAGIPSDDAEKKPADDDKVPVAKEAKSDAESPTEPTDLPSGDAEKNAAAADESAAVEEPKSDAESSTEAAGKPSDDAEKSPAGADESAAAADTPAPSEAPKPDAERPTATADKTSDASGKTPDDAGRTPAGAENARAADSNAPAAKQPSSDAMTPAGASGNALAAPAAAGKSSSKLAKTLFVPARLLSYLDDKRNGVAEVDPQTGEFAAIVTDPTYEDALVFARTIDDVPEIVANAMKRGFPFNAENARIEEIQQQDTSLQRLVVIVGALVFCFGVLTVFGVLWESTARKRTTIGIMRVMGASPLAAFIVVFLRALLLGTVAGGVTVAAGYACVLALTWTPGNDAYLAVKPVISAVIHPYDLYVVMAASVFCCVVGSIVPAIAAARLDPFDALVQGRYR